MFQAGIFLLPLAWWGGLENPFTTPKMGLLAAMDAALIPLLVRRTGARCVPWPWLLWIAAASLAAIFGRWVSLEALLLVLLPLPLAWALSTGLLPGLRLVPALLWGSATESAIAVLQYCRLDPLAVFWTPDLTGSSRMRVYGTLGNPDFVAAWLCAALPLYASPPPRGHRRWLWVAALALQIAAILATGSRVFLVAFPAMAAAFLLSGGGRSKWLAAGLPLAALLVWLSPARPLEVTVEGRLYLARVAASHWREIPLLGFGPGAFRMEFVPWQVEWFRTRSDDSRWQRYAGPVDHAHNDYLELAVEYGPVGLGAFLILSGALLRRPRPPGVWGGLAALLAIAAVDFPFHRPAEWSLYWLLLSGMHSIALKDPEGVDDGKLAQANDDGCRAGPGGAGAGTRSGIPLPGNGKRLPAGL